MKDNGLIAKTNGEMITPEQLYKEFYPSNQFVKNILNAKPNQKVIKVNTFANNSKFIPIGEIEMQLDEIFCGLWQTKNFQYSVVANEIVCSVELHVWHPIIKQWIVRTGTGAAMIQQEGWKKDEAGNYITSNGKKVKFSPPPTAVEYKIKNTLVKDFPHAKAEAVKNAAKSFGKFFGRDLNRGDDGGNFDDLLGNISKSAAKKPLSDEHFKNALSLVRNGQKTAESIKGMFSLTKEQVDQLDNIQTEAA